MVFSKEFRVHCPDGYIPIQVPGSWRKQPTNTYAPKAPIFVVKLKPTNDTYDLLHQITLRLCEYLDITSVCIGQLSKCHLNDFKIALNIDEVEAKRFIAENSQARNQDWVYTISSMDIFIFQRNPKSLISPS